MSEAFIRLAVPGDELGLHNAHMRSIREVCVKDHGEAEIRGWGYRQLGDRWGEAIGRGEVWVVERQGEIHGMACLRILKDGEVIKAYLNALYLTPEVLSKKFGARLMELMLAKAKGENVKSITLDSSITAHKFYQRFGFQDTGPAKKVEIGGYPVTAFPMELRIS